LNHLLIGAQCQTHHSTNDFWVIIMMTDAELALLRGKAVVEPDSLIDEIMTLKEAIRGHRDQKHLRYDTLDVVLWAHVDE